MTKELNLMLHCGANGVERQQIMELDAPVGTKTHFPIAHGTMLEVLDEHLEMNGMQVVAEAHSLKTTKDCPDAQYFGMLQVQPKGGDGGSLADDYGLILGLRNAHDKYFPAGVVLGSGVFVCDNLCFSGEVNLGRRHTKNIMVDLPALFSRAFGRLANETIKQDTRIATYRETDFGKKEADHFIMNALRQGAVNATRVPKVLAQWDRPNHPEFEERNAWSLLNAFTETYKGLQLDEVARRTPLLHGLFDSHCGLVFDEVTAA